MSNAAHRSEKALAMLREHAASLDPDSFVSEVIRVLEGEDEAPTAAPVPKCALCGETKDLTVLRGYAGVRGADLTVCRNRWACADRQIKQEVESRGT